MCLCFTKTIYAHIHKCYKINDDDSIKASGEDGKGIDNTDIVIIVNSLASCRRGLLAMGTSLRLDKNTDRPILGKILICPMNMDFSNVDTAISVLKHEIAHVLAFSTGLFAFFRDEKNQPLTPRDSDGYPNLGFIPSTLEIKEYLPHENTFKIFDKTEVTPVGSKTKRLAMLTTPNLLKEARKHFNCSDLSGVLMEDVNGANNGWSHFEKRLYYNYLMTATTSGVSITTRLDLAIMEDSGWYIPDYSLAQNSDFGKNLGCDFTNLSCYEYLQLKKSKQESSFPYCYEKGRMQCSQDRKKMLQCILFPAKKYFPAEYRYLDNKDLIDPDMFTDHCPMYPDISTQPSLVNAATSSCEHSNKKPDDKGAFSDIYKLDGTGRCFDTPKNGTWLSNGCDGVIEESMWGAGCYKYRCSTINRLLIEINNEEFQCYRDGQVLNITTTTGRSTINGVVTCPRCSELCKSHQCNINPVAIKRKISTKSVNCQIMSSLRMNNDASIIKLTFIYVLSILLTIAIIN